MDFIFKFMQFKDTSKPFGSIHPTAILVLEQALGAGPNCRSHNPLVKPTIFESAISQLAFLKILALTYGPGPLIILKNILS